MVEANARGREDMHRLFEEYNIKKDSYDIFSCKIEDYVTEKKYDIIIAEGFLPNVPNQNEIIEKCKSLLNKDGIIVITCGDNVGYFLESIKRLEGVILTQNIEKYEDKVDYLTSVFAPQLLKLNGMSRFPRDWVQDSLLNPAGINGLEFSMGDALDAFGEEYDLMGASPNMFNDYSWYKDVKFNSNEVYKNQFATKRLTLVMANMKEIVLSLKQVDELVELLSEIKLSAADYERDLNEQYLNNILEKINRVQMLIGEFDDEFKSVFGEIRQILIFATEGKNIDIENFPHFCAAFGRGMQYVSFMKK